jgi:hypothetical protein
MEAGHAQALGQGQRREAAEHALDGLQAEVVTVDPARVVGFELLVDGSE